MFFLNINSVHFYYLAIYLFFFAGVWGVLFCDLRESICFVDDHNVHPIQ